MSEPEYLKFMRTMDYRDQAALGNHIDPRDARIRELEAQVAELTKANDVFRNRLTRIVRWLEENEESVFRRGMWDAVWGNWKFKADNWRKVAEELAVQLEICIPESSTRQEHLTAYELIAAYNKAKAEEGR